MDFTTLLETLKPHAEQALVALRPILEKALALLLQLLAPLKAYWKKLSWNQRVAYTVIAVISYDVYSVASTKSQQHKVVEAAIGVEVKELVENHTVVIHKIVENHTVVTPEGEIPLRPTAGSKSYTDPPVDPSEGKTGWMGDRPDLCQEEGNFHPDLNHPHAHVCKCTDPKVPFKSTRGPIWDDHHETTVHDVKFVGSRPLDVVMLGDSLMEHWNGTHRWGTQHKTAQREVFDQFFTKAGGGALEGLALGSSADTAPNVLWHLQNGVLKDNLQPKVWMILVGTNDLSMTRCATEVVVQGIVAIAEYLSSQRPQAAVLIHGLLPRGQGGTNAFVLGSEWKRIQKVNRRLYEICREKEDHWYYWDTASLFMNPEKTALNNRLVADGIHPRISGMQMWGPKLVEAIQKVIQQEENT